MVFKGRRKVAPVYCQAVNSEMFGRRASRWQRVLRQSGARIRTLPGDRGHRSLAHQDQEPANQRQMRITQPGRKGSPPPALRLPQTKLSLKSNQIARGRIRRFESDMPSQAVRLLPSVGEPTGHRFAREKTELLSFFVGIIVLRALRLRDGIGLVACRNRLPGELFGHVRTLSQR
jgi:hypothetical protein